MPADPRADLRDRLAEVLTETYSLDPSVAPALSEAILGRHLSVVDVGGPGFELLEVVLDWRGLCGDVAEGRIMLPSGAFGGWLLLGGLRWVDAMRGRTARVARLSSGWEPAEVGPVEAAVCLALAAPDAEPPPLEATDRLGTLREHVEAILAEHGLDGADRPRVREARVRLERLRCLTPGGGWFRLADEVSFQVPEA